MRLPKNIDPCPIKDASVEIRFETSLPPDAVFGVVYNELKDTYGDLAPLPILQLPESVRINDLQLKFAPHYQMRKDSFVFQIGPKTIAVLISGDYPGWGHYLSEILSVFDRAKKLSFITEVLRVGQRYINVFDGGVFEQLNIGLTFNKEEIRNKETFLRTVFDEDDGFRTLLQIGNNVLIQKPDTTQAIGTLVDIDVFREERGLGFFDDMEKTLSFAHQIEKTRFFALIGSELLESLNPVYEEA